MITRKSITAVAATTLVLALGSASTSFAATSTPMPKKPSITGGVSGTKNIAGHETSEGTKVEKAKKSKKAASAAFTKWRRGQLTAKHAYKAELVAAIRLEEAATAKASKALTSATKVADLVAAKKALVSAKIAAKMKFNAAIAALGVKPLK